MKAYKGFNKDLTCRGFQYEEGKTYEEQEAKLCESGFHACENPVMCFGHYAPGSSVYHAVELEDVAQDRESDTKCVGKKITIGAKLGIPEICQLTFEYVKAHCTNEHNAQLKGGLGAILVIVEENESDYGIKDWKAVEVDGEKIKADTWYKLENGEIIECE